MGCGAGKSSDPSPSSTSKDSSGGNGELLKKYALGKVLGQGAFGVVYKCKKKGSDQEFAVKMIDQVETPLAQINKEAEMLRKLEHPTCIKLHDVFYEKVFVCMVLEFYAGGDMIQGMMAHWKSKGMIPMANVKFLSKQMHEAVAWVHSQKCVHRDIKGDNFMMGLPLVENPKQKLYLSDFGTVKELHSGERLTEKCGTKNYWPPEFYKLNYAMKVDCWAVGVVMFGLCSGKFPFSGEQDVRHKQVKIPSRCPEEGQELINSLLERDENKRSDCANALKHRFIANEGSVCGQPNKEETTTDFKPEMKDKGANAGVAQRRAELVDRLQNKGRGSILKVADMKNQTFTCTDPQTDRTLTFDWWMATKTSAMVSTFANAQQLAADAILNHEVTSESVKKQMVEHNLQVSGFGKGSAKSFDAFVEELQKGQSRLLLDATKHKFMVRSVDIVVVKLILKSSDGRGRILVDLDEGLTMGRTRPGASLIQSAKLPQESFRQAADRVAREMLSAPDVKITWGTDVQDSEESTNLPEYPGIQTVYRKEMLVGELQNVSEAVMKQIGGSTYNFKKGSRSFAWLTDKECNSKGIVLQPRKTDFSALVAPPIGLDEEELTEFLSKNSIDTSKWGTGTYKSLEDFSEELTAGESTLTKTAAGKIQRVVDIVVMQLVKKETGEVLVEAAETFKGSKQELNRLPAVKRRSDEHLFTAARRLVTKYLQLPDSSVTLDTTDVRVVEEEQESKAYLGLSTMYRKRFIKASLVSA
mmetsp:Transcript_71012/g.148538  ORF Transcript_71012/g.148538 Transcript_71012/m.148538 type:complete len:755 (+) Transcript_71012:238-2502(+)